MNHTQQIEPPRRLALVWTRSLDGERMAGRLHVARAIRTALSTGAELESFRLPSVLSDRTAPRMAGALAALGGSWLRGRPLPLQCALFSSSGDIEAIGRAIPQDVGAIYLDGIRCCELLRYLRRTRPGLRIVVDFDDSMSRRMELLLAAGQPLSPGYLSHRLPPLLRRFVTFGAVGRAVVLYECWTLRALERQMLTLADAIVLLSSKEADALDAIRATTPSARADVAAVPPPAELVDAKPLTSPLRFTFVGTDTLTQNRLTIDYLLDLWGRRRIATPLVIFGQQTRKVRLPPGVTAPGYASDLNDVFDGHSVLLTPSFLRGGVKTKVLEAFSRRAPVIGNDQTFESMDLDDYPLRINDEDVLVELLRDPETRRDVFDVAALRGRDYVRAHHAPSVFAERWRALMGLEPTSPSAGDSDGPRNDD